VDNPRTGHSSIQVSDAPPLAGTAESRHDTARRLPAEALLLGTVLLWSFNFTAVRYGVTNAIDPMVYVALRWVIAGLALTGIALLRGTSLRLGRNSLAIVALASIVGVVVNQIAFAYSVHLAPASAVALIFGTLPIFVSVMSQLVGHEQLRRRHWAAVGISFSGVALVAAGSSGGVRASVGGILLALATTFSFAVYSVAIVRPLRHHSPLAVSAASSSIGGLILCLVAVPWLASEDWAAPPALAWSGLLYSALASVVVGNLLWFVAIERVGASRSALYTNLQPFFGALFAVLVLSEHLDALQLVGGLVIASGIAVAGRIKLHAQPID
jgi:drug/metabolite transporter (DMT)-like permease